jgi:hypothetical protein
MNVFQKAELAGDDPVIIRRLIDLCRAQLPEEVARFTQLWERFFDLKILYMNGTRTPQLTNEMRIVNAHLRDYRERLAELQNQYHYVTVW